MAKPLNTGLLKEETTMDDFNIDELLKQIDEKIAELENDDSDSQPFDFSKSLLSEIGICNDTDMEEDDFDDISGHEDIGHIIKVTGTIELPCDIRLFKIPCTIKIKSRYKTIEALLTEQYCNSTEYLCMKNTYRFLLLESDDKIYVLNFKLYMEDHLCFSGLSEERVQKQNYDKRFVTNINKKYGERVRVGYEIEGVLGDKRTEGDVEYFNITTYDRVKYSCAVDWELMSDTKIDELQLGEIYRFKGLMDNGIFYVMRKKLKRQEAFIAENYPEEERDVAKRLLGSLNVKQQDCIIQTVERGSSYGNAEFTAENLFTNKNELKAKYALCKHTYPIEVQQEIEKCFAELKVPIGSDKTTKRVLSMLINTDWSREISLNFDIEYIRKGLDETHYGMAALKEDLITLISTNEQKKEKRGAVILLNGPAGVGKTSLAKRFAELCGLPFKVISLNGVSTPMYLSGTPRLYDNAFPGIIARTIREIGLRSVIVLDEIDKMCASHDGDPYTCLYDLFDLSGVFEDQFLEVGIDMSDTIFILTSNKTENIPEPILNRCEIVSVDGYEDTDKFNIAKHYIIPQTAQMYGLTKEDMDIDDSAIDDLANRYNITDGVREIERNVLRVIKTIVKKRKKNHAITIAVNSKSLPAMLNLPPCLPDKIEHSKAGLENKFKHFHYSYPKEVRSKIKNLFTEYEGCKSDAEKEMTLKSLFYLINILPIDKKKTYNLSKIKHEMDVSHYGLADVKEQILMNLAARNASGYNLGKCLLLNGMCGIGKTSICKTLAYAMDMPFVKISLNGVSHPEHIKGFERTYQKSEAGEVVKNLAEQGKTSVFVLLDEIDKMSAHNGEDPYAALLDLLDDSKKFTDNFLGIPIDISDVFFVATSNYIEKIPEAVLDRMEVIELGGYEKSEKGEILRTHIIPKQLQNYKSEDKIFFTDEAIKILSDKYCPSYGMRDADMAVGKIIKKLILENYNSAEQVKVTPLEAKRILGAAPIGRGNVSMKKRPGIARALAVSGNRGTTFAIQVTDNPYGKNEITGLPKQSALDSVTIAKLLVSKYINKELPPMHIHFGEGGIEKDGPSAGITIFSAMLSHVLHKPIDRYTAFTGEIDVYGDVWAIGGVDLKIKAAINEGCNRVFIPYDNYVQLEDDGDLDKYDIDIIPMQSVYELVGMLFGNTFSEMQCSENR